MGRAGMISGCGGPAVVVVGVGGAQKGGWRISFGCAAAPARPGNGVIAPFRGGRGAGWRVKDQRRPPFEPPDRPVPGTPPPATRRMGRTERM